MSDRSGIAAHRRRASAASSIRTRRPMVIREGRGVAMTISELDRPVRDAAAAAPSTDASARAATILIIDDDPVITFLLRNVIARAGYRCLVARDGEAAWQVLSPDVSLVLLDIMMPGQNGPEILRRMRQDPMLADIPVIFVTGRTDA